MGTKNGLKMMKWLVGLGLINARLITENFAEGNEDMNKKANRLCKEFFRDFHNVLDSDLITNVEINNGHQGSVYRCACDDCPDVNPNVVAQKLFKEERLQDFNMTDMNLIR